jgi:hypothetical protein
LSSTKRTIHINEEYEANTISAKMASEPALSAGVKHEEKGEERENSSFRKKFRFLTFVT